MTAVGIQRDRVIDRSAGDFMNQMDARFLAIALRQLLRCVDWARKFEPSVVDSAKAVFDGSVPKAVQVRDILSHFDEYDQGAGRLQTRNQLRDYAEFYVRFEDHYMLRLAEGYELDVQPAVLAAERLVDTVHTALVGRGR